MASSIGIIRAVVMYAIVMTRGVGIPLDDGVVIRSVKRGISVVVYSGPGEEGDGDVFFIVCDLVITRDGIYLLHYEEVGGIDGGGVSSMRLGTRLIDVDGDASAG